MNTLSTKQNKLPTDMFLPEFIGLNKITKFPALKIQGNHKLDFKVFKAS